MPRLPVTAISMLVYGAFLSVSVAVVAGTLARATAPQSQGEAPARWHENAAARPGIAPAWLSEAMQASHSDSGPARLPH